MKYNNKHETEEKVPLPLAIASKSSAIDKNLGIPFMSHIANLCKVLEERHQHNSALGNRILFLTALENSTTRKNKIFR